MPKDPTPLRSRSLRLPLFAVVICTIASAAWVYFRRSEPRLLPKLEEATAPASTLSPTPSHDVEVPTTEHRLEVKNPNLLDVVVYPDGRPIIAVGTEGTLLRSEDDGKSYSRVESNSREYFTRALIEPDSGAVLVIGSGGTLLRSDDRGLTFTPILLDTKATLNAIAQSATTKTIVICGDDGVAYSSTDLGKHFAKEHTGITQLLTELVAVPSPEGVFVAAGDLGIALLRAPSGQWRHVDTPSQKFVTALAQLVDGSLLAGLAEGIIVRSTDNGGHWQEVYRSANENYVMNFESSPKSDVVIARFRNQTLRSSRDRGQIFTAVDLPAKQVPSAFTWVEEHGFVGLSSGGGTVRSNLQGTAWHFTAARERMRATKMTVNAKTRSVLAVGMSGFLGRLTPSNTQVESVKPDLGSLIRSVAYAPNTDTIVGIGLDATLIRSLDGGKSYQRHAIALAPKSELTSVTYDPRTSAFVAGTSTGTIYRSDTNGKSFVRQLELGKEILQLHALGNGRILALCSDQGARLSSDGGKTFATPIPNFTGTLRYGAAGCTPNSVLVLGDHGALLHSTNDGKTYIPIASNVATTLRYFVCEPNSNRIWIVGDHGTLLRSDDAALSFRRLAIPTDENLFTLGFSDDGNVLYIGGNAGTLLRSIDRGQTFTFVSTGLQQPIRLTQFIPDFSEFVIAGVGGLLMVTHHRTIPQRLAGRFEGRFDQMIVHSASKSVIVAGDRLLRLAPP